MSDAFEEWLDRTEKLDAAMDRAKASHLERSRDSLPWHEFAVKYAEACGRALDAAENYKGLFLFWRTVAVFFGICSAGFLAAMWFVA